jgi:hypothetical protein
MFTAETRHNPHFCQPSFPAGYRGFALQPRPKNAQKVAKKFELGPQELELCPAGSNLGAPQRDT